MNFQRWECKKCNNLRDKIQEALEGNYDQVPEFTLCDSCLPYEEIDEVEEENDVESFFALKISNKNIYFIRKEDRKLIICNPWQIEVLVEKVCHSDHKQKLFDFLALVIPNFINISAVAKEKLVNSFQLQQYLPG